jgi:penicillin-binding protein 1C
MMFFHFRSRILPPCAASWGRVCRVAKSGRRTLARYSYFAAAIALIGWTLAPYFLELPEDLVAPRPSSPRMLDRNGEVLADFPRPDLFRHQPVSLEDVPRSLLDATLVAEDKRFFSHDGMDYLATARATRDLLQEGRVVSGASTITQQLVKISSPAAKRNVLTKVREALTARHLEYEWSKKEILTAYFNRLDYGNHRQGCHEAARFYFGKPLGDLSLAESALLAGLPQSPSLHNPLRNPKSALKRRDWILDRLASELDYDSDAIAAAKAEPLQLFSTRRTDIAPHLASAMRSSAGDVPTIETTIDGSLQRTVNAIVREELARLRQSNTQHAALVVLDNGSGEVLAMVGSGDFTDPRGGQINGALIPRSAGSTLKPFTYVLAFEQRGLSPGSMIADIPTPYRTEEGLDLPKNYDHKHYGPVTIRYALANSLNVSAMRTLNRVGGPAPLHALLRKVGISTLAKPAAEYGLGLTIGNAEVTLLELTNAYATLARLGKFKDTRLLRHPPDPQLVSAKGGEDGIPVPTPQASYLIADILSDNNARSAAFGVRSALRLPFQCAVKTGTSSDFRDNWCIGFTRDLTVGVWVGNFDNTPMRGVSGVSGAGPIFQRTMLALHEEREATWPVQPEGLVRITIDSRTGHRFLGEVQAGQPFAQRELCLAKRLPLPVREEDYDSRHRAIIDQRFHEWFTSADNNRHAELALAQERPLDLSPKIVSPMPTAIYLLDPELPSGGHLLKLLSNLPTGARWASPTLRIVGDVAHLTPGRHEITLTDSESGSEISQKITVESL